MLVLVSGTSEEEQSSRPNSRPACKSKFVGSIQVSRRHFMYVVVPPWSVAREVGGTVCEGSRRDDA
jgi:hypothetical protein